MYLSRLTLNLRHRAVRRDLSNRHDLHRTVMSAFPEADGGRAELKVLFRLEAHGRAPMLYVQSAKEPDWTALPEDYLEVDFMDGPPAAKPLDRAWGALAEDRQLRFRLQANPRKQTFVRGGRGPRVSLRQPEAIHEWLARRAEASGFSVPRLIDGSLAVEIRPLDDVVGWKKGGQGKGLRITLGAVQLDGRLRVTDLDRFRSALVAGVGGGRAYGFGLLSIAPMA